MSPHVLDHLSLGKIVRVRERLLAAQAAGRAVLRSECVTNGSMHGPFVTLTSLLFGPQCEDAVSSAYGCSTEMVRTGTPVLRAMQEDAMAARAA